MSREDFSLQQWLTWMEENHPQAIDLGLERVSEVYRAMNLDLSASRVITVAGTNGKGTTIAMLESIYLAAGYSTLAYTSPHLNRYNERVRVLGSEIADQPLVEAFRAVDAARGDISLTYFEMGTLAALWLVAEQQPNVALMEVGLGGRLDAINIIEHDISVITTIDIDHIDWLGDDREQIGREKSGIMRAGRPAVCGELNPTASIAQVAGETGAVLYQSGVDFSYQVAENSFSCQGKNAEDQWSFEALPLPGLPVQNAATALQVISVAGIECSADAIATGLSRAGVAGRLQQASHKGCEVILDVAHNPQSAGYLSEQLSKRYPDGVEIVIGVLSDKDCQAVIQALKQQVSSWHVIGLDMPRGQTAEQLAALIAEQGVDTGSIQCYGSIAEALDGAVAVGKTVIVAGSFFTVGMALEALQD